MKSTSLLIPLLAFVIASFSVHPSAHIGAGAANNSVQSDSSSQSSSTELEGYIHSIYSHPNLFEQLPAFPVFEKAIRGYLGMRQEGLLSGKQIITIIDFSLSSCEKRLWTIDLDKKLLLFHTLVSHGKNTGTEYARKFSNIPQSLQSSLGFYVTGGTYQGKHGLSLYLDGAEKGFNHEARDRYIVMHGADYVSEAFVEKHGRLGRSFGCPAVPYGTHSKIIPKIKDKTCLFIYYPDEHYLSNSSYLNSSEETLIASKGE